jgi:phospholipid/cholesterol/gamma-HCH transport system substrate-binding protein
MTRQARLGLVVLAGIAAFVLFLFILAGRTFLLADTFRVHAEFNEVGGLLPGASVQYQGVAVGRVDFVQLPAAPGAPIRVGMAIRERARHLVRLDSRAVVQTEGLVGQMMVVLTGGSQDQPIVAEGGTITGVDPFSISAVTERLFESVSRFDDVTVSMVDMMTDIRTGEGTLGRFLYDPALYDEAVFTARETRQAMRNITTRADAFVGIAADASEGVRSILHKIDTGEGSLARLLNEDDIYVALLDASETFRGAAGDIGTITDRAETAANWATLAMFRLAENMQALKDNWFFRSYYERRGFREHAPFEVREQALSETFEQLEQRERELYERELELRGRETGTVPVRTDGDARLDGDAAREDDVEDGVGVTRGDEPEVDSVAEVPATGGSSADDSR